MDKENSINSDKEIQKEIKEHDYKHLQRNRKYKTSTEIVHDNRLGQFRNSSKKADKLRRKEHKKNVSKLAKERRRNESNSRKY